MFILAHHESQVNRKGINIMTEEIKTRQKRVSFPYISIGKAIENAGKLKAYKGFAPINIRDALIKMGYAPKSSSGDRALSTMARSYGLLEQQGTKEKGGIVQFTPLAKKILSYPLDSPERQNGIQQAITTDELLQKALDKWSDGVLPGRKNIIAELQFDSRFGGFTLDAATRFATVIQETFEFLDPSKYNGTDVQEETEERGDEMLTQTLERSEKTTKVKEYGVPLTGGATAVLRLPTSMKEKDFTRIIKWFDLMKDALLDEQEEETTE
jgi:hypothetical protein